MDAPLSTDFLAQAEELIDSLFDDIRELRRPPALTGRARRSLVDQTFRHAHTLKGSAATLPRLEAASRLAHELENLLEAVRAGRLATDDAVLDACDDATEALSRLVLAASRGEVADAPPEVVARLRQLAAHPADVQAGPDDSSASDSGDDAHATLPASLGLQLNARERLRLSEATKEGARPLLVEAAFDLEVFDERFARLTEALGESVEIIATLPGAANAEPTRINLRLLCAITAPTEELTRALAPFDAQVVALAPEEKTETRSATRAETAETAEVKDETSDEATVEMNAETVESSAAETDEASADEWHGGQDTRDSPGARSSSSAAASVRVPLAELDELVFAANELFDDAVRALDAARASTGADGASRIDEIAPRLRENFHALIERVMSLRMRTLSRTLEVAARGARVAARRAGKRIEIEIEGGEARVERSAAERIAEPLAHLLRNAVDHGIELPRERRAVGKPERGIVRVVVRVEGSRVRVSVADDGRGIDLVRVEGAARARGLIGAGISVSEEQALRLIFRPGFSTAANVSMLSGRGVGLDAVEHEIERAGGEVRVRTRAGAGTTFELNLPLALALVPCVLVESGGYAYAFDASRVVETISSGDAELIGEGEGEGRTIRWREEHLPLIKLRALLDQASSSSHDDDGTGARVVIIVRADDTRNDYARDDALDGGAVSDSESSPRHVALAVDRALGRRDALVSSLGRHATRWRGVSGAIDLRDGTVALMLDVSRLWES